MKVITICGSMRFADEMIKIAEKLEIERKFCVIQCVYGPKRGYEKDQIELIAEIHKKKIDISDAIYVVNIDGYIGESTKSEIDYAKQNNKEIIYHVELK